MQKNIKDKSNNLTLVIHCTDNSFGFACRSSEDGSDVLFIKQFNNDLCNNLIFDFSQFISKEKLQKVNKISVSTGPSNFNASRLIVVLARTIAQQINCPLNSFTAFELMAKRIAKKNNIRKKNHSFWIYKKLKRKGFIAGKYQVSFVDKENQNITIKESIVPKIVKELKNQELNFQANYNDEEDLRELLDLSNNNSNISNLDSWGKVLPLYFLSPTN